MRWDVTYIYVCLLLAVNILEVYSDQGKHFNANPSNTIQLAQGWNTVSDKFKESIAWVGVRPMCIASKIAFEESGNGAD